jgi:anti-sigma factor RsiW
MQTSLCPSPDELKAYVRGKLDSQQSDLLSEHMLYCPACERTIVEIEAEPDTLVELLKCEVAFLQQQAARPTISNCSIKLRRQLRGLMGFSCPQSLDNTNY